MIVTTCIKSPKARELFAEEYGSLFDDAYLDKENKRNCATAKSYLAIAKMYFEENNLGEVIKLTSKANIYYGIAVYGYHYQLSKSKQASAAALKGKANNRSIKEEALAYYAEHKILFKSKSKAAEFISAKIVPMSYRAVYGWIRKIDQKS